MTILRRLTFLFLILAGTAFGQSATQCLPAGQPNVYVLCSSAPQPNFVQAPLSQISSGSVASINKAYGSNTTKGNTLVVVFANGNNNNPTAPITDTLSLTWFKAVQVANSTAFETEIWYAPNTVGGADTVTVTPGGTNASIAMTIYEVAGLVYPAVNSSPSGPQALDQTTSGTVTSGTSPSVSLTPVVPNEYVFVGFGLGTAAQTITVGSPYNNDSGQQNPTTPAGLFSFVSASLFKTEMATTSPSATATSEPWAVAVASFKTLSNPVQGTVEGLGSAGTPVGGVVSVQGVSGGQTLPVVCTAANCPVNVAQVAGSSASTAATGILKVGVVGNAGAAVDQAPGSAAPANAVMEGLSDGTNTRFAQSDTNGRQLVRNYPDTTTTSYHASASFAGSSTTDNAVMPGNATNTVLLNKVTVTCTETAAGIVTLTLIKRSAADTSGTSSSLTKVPDDANYTAAVSAPLTYTGTGPSVGTPVGNLDVAQFGCNASATAGPNDIYIFRPMKPIILRGTAQQVAVNMGNAAITGGTLTVTFEWEETTTP